MNQSTAKDLENQTHMPQTVMSQQPVQNPNQQYYVEAPQTQSGGCCGGCCGGSSGPSRYTQDQINQVRGTWPAVMIVAGVLCFIAGILHVSHAEGVGAPWDLLPMLACGVTTTVAGCLVYCLDGCCSQGGPKGTTVTAIVFSVLAIAQSYIL